MNEPFISESIDYSLKLHCYDFGLLSHNNVIYKSIKINQFKLFNYYPLTEYLTYYGGKPVCIRSLRCDYVTPQQLIYYCRRVKLTKVYFVVFCCVHCYLLRVYLFVYICLWLFYFFIFLFFHCLFCLGLGNFDD